MSDNELAPVTMPVLTPKKCDLIIGKIDVAVVTRILVELSLLNVKRGSWWDRNIELRMSEFKNWIGDLDCPSKIISRKYVASKAYQSILDCGCGLCTEYYGYQNDNYSIKYIGLDSCEKLVQTSAERGINVKFGSVEQIPLPDNSVDISLARHVVEHIFSYEKAISEMIRVALKEAVVIFFIPPVDLIPPASDCLKFDAEEEIWHNQYQKTNLEQFVLNNPKVSSISWDELPDTKESILHINLKFTAGANT